MTTKNDKMLGETIQKIDNKKRQNFGGNTALESVSFDGWWMVGGGRSTFFRPHSSSELSIYPSYIREENPRSARKKKHCSLITSLSLKRT